MSLTLRAASFAFLLIASIMIFLWFPYSPLQDLGEWIYQGFVFNEIVSGHSTAFVLKSYPVPYTLVQVFISASLTLFNPLLTSKLIVAAYGVLALWASHRLIRAYDLNRPVAWAALISIFVLNGPFWSGYIAYQFGLAGFTLYLSLAPRWRTDIRVLIALSVLAFFTHGMIYFAFVSVAAAFSFTERRLTIFAASIVPSIVLALWYVHANVTSTVGGPAVLLPHFQDFLGYKLYTFMKLGPYHHFVISAADTPGRFEPLASAAGTALNLLFLLGLAFLLSSSRIGHWRRFLHEPEALFGAAFVCLACVLSPTAMGVGNPSERLIYPAFIALSTTGLKFSGGEGSFKLRTIAHRAVSLALIAGFALSATGLISAGLTYDRDIRRDRLVTAVVTNFGNYDRARFAHRMVQFDHRMREANREWRSGEAPSMALAFDTALLRDSR